MKNFIRLSALLFAAMSSLYLSSCAGEESPAPAATGNSEDALSMSCTQRGDGYRWDSYTKLCECKITEHYQKQSDGSCVEEQAWATKRTACQSRSADFDTSTGACNETVESCSRSGQVLMPLGLSGAGKTCTTQANAHNTCKTNGITYTYDAASGTCRETDNPNALGTTADSTDCTTRGGSFNATTNVCTETASSCNAKLPVGSWAYDARTPYTCVPATQVQNNGGILGSLIGIIPGVLGAVLGSGN